MVATIKKGPGKTLTLYALHLAALMAEKGMEEHRRVTITEVAKGTGITRQTLQGWYSNTITRFDAPVIDALCEFFGCQPGDLFTYVPKEPEPGE